MSPETLHELDLVELSDVAWEVVDPDGEYEAQERTWVALLPREWPPVAGVAALRVRLAEVVEAVVPAAPAVPLRLVAALMAFLAAHPERRVIDDALLAEAIAEELGEGREEASEWLAQRRRAVPARRRAHGARHPLRRFHVHPSPPDQPGP